MNNTVKIQNTLLLQTAKRLNELYHNYAVSHGLSDPALNILYTLFDTDGPVTQNDLAVMWSYPKQTINFTISGFVKKGYIRLERLAGARNSKAVRLTDEGQRLCQAMIAPLLESEERSLLRMTEEERELMVKLEEKQCRYFEEEIREMIQKKGRTEDI